MQKVHSAKQSPSPKGPSHLHLTLPSVGGFIVYSWPCVLAPGNCFRAEVRGMWHGGLWVMLMGHSPPEQRVEGVRGRQHQSSLVCKV